MQCGMSSTDFQSEDDQGAEVECEEDPLNWQSVVSRGILASLTPQEIKRQEVINGEATTLDASPSLLSKIAAAGICVSIHPQSCSTQSVPTYECWRCWIVCSTRGWTEMGSFHQRTSSTSSWTWRKSFSCTVMSFKPCDYVRWCSECLRYRISHVSQSSLCFTVFITEQMTAIRKRNETSVIGQIGDDLLSWVRVVSVQKA